jgi:hypothetical protein
MTRGRIAVVGAGAAGLAAARLAEAGVEHPFVVSADDQQLTGYSDGRPDDYVFHLDPCALPAVNDLPGTRIILNYVLSVAVPFEVVSEDPLTFEERGTSFEDRGSFRLTLGSDTKGPRLRVVSPPAGLQVQPGEAVEIARTRQDGCAAPPRATPHRRFVHPAPGTRHPALRRGRAAAHQRLWAKMYSVRRWWTNLPAGSRARSDRRRSASKASAASPSRALFANEVE